MNFAADLKFSFQLVSVIIHATPILLLLKLVKKENTKRRKCVCVYGFKSMF